MDSSTIFIVVGVLLVVAIIVVTQLGNFTWWGKKRGRLPSDDGSESSHPHMAATHPPHTRQPNAESSYPQETGNGGAQHHGGDHPERGHQDGGHERGQSGGDVGGAKGQQYHPPSHDGAGGGAEHFTNPTSTTVPANAAHGGAGVIGEMAAATANASDLEHAFKKPIEPSQLAAALPPTNTAAPSPTTPNECYPKNDVLQPAELLPQDNNGTWAASAPDCKNSSVFTSALLQAGAMCGTNTIGTSLRNANLQLRSEVPNPRTQVSPWLNSTIDADLLRKPLC